MFVFPINKIKKKNTDIPIFINMNLHIRHSNKKPDVQRPAVKNKIHYLASAKMSPKLARSKPMKHMSKEIQCHITLHSTNMLMDDSCFPPCRGTLLIFTSTLVACINCFSVLWFLCLFPICYDLLLSCFYFHSYN